jgi:hypothetical protein
MTYKWAGFLVPTWLHDGIMRGFPHMVAKPAGDSPNRNSKDFSKISQYQISQKIHQQFSSSYRFLKIQFGRAILKGTLQGCVHA